MTRYCIDSSSLIRAWSEAYPPNLLPAVWKCLDRLLRSGLLMVPREVIEEIKRLDGDLFKWLKDRPEAVEEPDRDIQDACKAVLSQAPQILAKNSRRNEADPWVISTAMAKGGHVVSEEVAKGRGNKIPEVCDQVGVPCVNLLRLITLECQGRELN